EEALVVTEVDLDAVAQRRLHDTRRRVELRDREESLELDRIAVPGLLPAAGPFERQHTSGEAAQLLPDLAEVWSALVLGTRDYVRKTGFQQVIIGLSGGIDSSI